MTRDQEKLFLSSFPAQDAVRQLVGLGVPRDRAAAVVATTTETLAEHVRGGEGGLAWMAHAVSRLFGAGGPGRLSPQDLDAVAGVVAERSRLSPTTARAAVDLVHPRWLAFVKETTERAAA